MGKINIEELLKYCPKGMKLNCTIWGWNIEFDYINIKDKDYPIVCHDKWPDGKYNIRTFTKYGCYNICDSKCVIFPEGEITWEGFVPPCKFKDGDIVYMDFSDYNIISFFKKIDKELYYYYVGLKNGQELQIPASKDNKGIYCTYYVKEIRFATGGEKEKLFNAIKDNGYRWNAETKNLEKLIEPNFKIGDRITPILNRFQYIIKGMTDTHYIMEEVEYGYKYTVPIIEDKNWKLVTNKFDISTLKPFNKVLVRNNSLECWHIQFFENYNKQYGVKYPFICLCNNKYSQCIPFESNEYLLDTANDCMEYYKTWE